MFGGSKVKLSDDLVNRVKKCASVAGFSSADEFITRALEKKIAALQSAEKQAPDQPAG